MSDFEPPRMPTGDEHRHRRQLRPSPDELDTGDVAGTARAAHPYRRFVAPAVVALAAVLIAALLIWGPGSPLRNGTETPSSPTSVSPDSASSAPPTAPMLPDTFDEYVRQSDPQSADPTDDQDVAVATGTYTRNGQPALLVIAAVPVPDLSLFLQSLGATDPAPVGVGWCATYDEEPLCGVTTDQTAWLVSPLAGQPEDELVRLATLLGD